MGGGIRSTELTIGMVIGEILPSDMKRTGSVGLMATVERVCWVVD